MPLSFDPKILVYVKMCSAYAFFPRRFMVSGLTLMSLINFQFIFLYGVRRHSNFVLLYVAVQFSQHYLVKRLFLSIIYSCLLCHRLSAHKCVDLFPAPLFSSIDLSCASTMLDF